MTEKELRLFSEFLEQREYAQKDYMIAVPISGPAASKYVPDALKTSTSQNTIITSGDGKHQLAVRPLPDSDKSLVKKARHQLAQDLNRDRKKINSYNIPEKDKNILRDNALSNMKKHRDIHINKTISKGSYGGLNARSMTSAPRTAISQWRRLMPK